MRSEIAIDAAAMGDPQRENQEFRVSACVDDPVEADPDPPQIQKSDERSSAASYRSTSSAGTLAAARC